MKECIKCLVIKEENLFGENKTCKDGLRNSCKECCNKQGKDYKKTKKGLIGKIYGNQRSHCRARGYLPPSYTNLELQDWVLNQDNFENLYFNWVKSGYMKKLIPSIDRLDDYKSYSFENIQLITWRDNEIKGRNDCLNGINNKKSKAVIGTHIETQEKIEFHSIKEAERQTRAIQSNITKCCNGTRNHAGGYMWNFKNND